MFVYYFQVTSDVSDNLICLNGKLTALKKFTNKLNELNNWVMEKKLEAEDINQKPFSERKLATDKLHVIFYFFSLIVLFFNILSII